MMEKLEFLHRERLHRCFDEWLDKWEEKRLNCPEWGRTLPVQGPHERVLQTRAGKIILKHPYFCCEVYQKGFYPLDEALDLSERQNQWNVQRQATKLSKEVPYEIACKLFKV
jgi:hypothetical protein